jgi:acyl-coenzyme A thioesterase PaaI-like protein
MDDAEGVGIAARFRSAAREAGGTWPARAALGDALRALLEQLPDADVDEATLQAGATAVQELATRLEAAPRIASAEGSAFAGMGHFQHTSPIVGLSNPVAPPFEFAVDEVAGEVRGRGTFGKIHEGAPGIVHGGLLAAVLDELLGLATVFSGGPGMTGTLTIRYLHPTPTHQELVLTGRLDETKGRRLHVSAECQAGERVTARAEGLFVSVGAQKFGDLEEARRNRHP